MGKEQRIKVTGRIENRNNEDLEKSEESLKGLFAFPLLLLITTVVLLTNYYTDVGKGLPTKIEAIGVAKGIEELDDERYNIVTKNHIKELSTIVKKEDIKLMYTDNKKEKKIRLYEETYDANAIVRAGGITKLKYTLSDKYKKDLIVVVPTKDAVRLSVIDKKFNKADYTSIKKESIRATNEKGNKALNYHDAVSVDAKEKLLNVLWVTLIIMVLVTCFGSAIIVGSIKRDTKDE